MTSDASVGRTGFASALRKYRWTLLLPVALASAATSVVAYSMPTRYKSASIIELEGQRIPADYVKPTSNTPLELRIEHFSEQVLSRSRLERVILDLDLYPEYRQHAVMADVIARMRSDVTIAPVAPHGAASDPAHRFIVQFVAGDPRTAQRVAERMSQMVLEAVLREKAALAQGTTQFLTAMKEGVADQIDQHAKAMAQQRASNRGAAVPRAMELEQEVLEDTYRVLATRLQEARLATGLESRELGEQLRLIEAARLPDKPIGPNRLMVSLAGPAFGLILGLGLVLASSRRKREAASVG